MSFFLKNHKKGTKTHKFAQLLIINREKYDFVQL